jgi:hypothetical protein
MCLFRYRFSQKVWPTVRCRMRRWSLDILIGGAVLPSLLHQDPRYLYQGTGTKMSRTLHAIFSPFIAKGDNGHWQLNYSSVDGDLASGALSNLYYPSSNRGPVGLYQRLDYDRRQDGQCFGAGVCASQIYFPSERTRPEAVMPDLLSEASSQENAVVTASTNRFHDKTAPWPGAPLLVHRVAFVLPHSWSPHCTLPPRPMCRALAGIISARLRSMHGETL